MNLAPTHIWRFLLLTLCATAAAAQVASSPPPSAPAPPVPYTSVSDLNLILSQLQDLSKSTQEDLAKLRIQKWKADAATKRGTQADVESVQRNLQMAMPEIIGQLQASPENIAATFKLYRNLDALYDVLGPVVESAGAFGSKDEFQNMQNDFSSLERARRSLAERMDTLATAKEGELTHLRTQVRDLQAAAIPPPPVKKAVVVDDTEPPKKPTKKKPTKSPKPAAPTPPPAPTQTNPTSSLPH